MLLQPGLVDLLDLLWGQLECHGAEIVTHALLLATRRQHNDILIHTPPQQDLALAHGILLRESSEVPVKRTRRALDDGRQRTICLRRNALFSPLLLAYSSTQEHSRGGCKKKA